MAEDPSSLFMDEISDPRSLVGARARRERFDRNSAWFQTHADEIYAKHRGRCVSVSGEELFIGDSVVELLARARAAHPDDDGKFVLYIPREKLARVYAHRR